MILVGGYEVDPSPGDYRLLTSMFSRLPREVRFAGRFARLVGLECSEGGRECLRFLGVEVEELGTIPEGLVAWEFSANAWRVLRPDHGHGQTQWQGGIQWHWLERFHSSPDRRIGEFSAPGAAAWWGASFPSTPRFSLFAHVHLDPNKDGFRDEVDLVDPDPSWPEQYQRMAGWLRQRLGPGIALRVEHYGSTSIPGVPAKPVVDILVEIPSFDEGKRRALPVLDDETWEYWWYSGHMAFFKRKCVMEERTHHVHLAPRDHAVWRGLAFRDYLRRHPEDADRYAKLKYRLARAYRMDREQYTQAKSEFVHQITRKALGVES